MLEIARNRVFFVEKYIVNPILISEILHYIFITLLFESARAIIQAFIPVN